MKIPIITNEINKLESRLTATISNEVKSNVESLKRNFVSTKLTKTYNNDGSYFDRKNKGIATISSSLRCEYGAYNEASNDLLFHNNYITIKSLVFAHDIEVHGRFNSGVSWYTTIYNYLELNKIAKTIFKELYKGTGIGVIIFDENKFDLIPYYNKGKQQFTFKNGYCEIEIGFGLKKLIPEQNCLIVNEDMVQSTDTAQSRSTLGRVIDLLDLKFRALEAQKRLANKDYQSDKLLSPNYGKFPKPVDNNDLASTVNEVSENIDKIVTDLNAVNNTSGTFALSTPFDIVKISQTNAETRIIELLQYIDQQIYLGCGLNGTFLNTDSSNKASAEAGMDNVRETVINHFQSVIIECLEWCLSMVDNDFIKKGYTLKFKVNENDETFKKRDQALLVLKDILPVLTTLGKKVTDKSIQELLDNFGLELETTILDNEVEQSQEVRSLSNINYHRASKANMPKTSFSNIEKTTEYIKIVDEVKQKLANQYDDFISPSNTKRIKVGNLDYPNLENYLTENELTSYSETMKDLAVEDYQKEYQKKITKEQNFKKKIETKVSQSIKGDGNNNGTGDTTAKMLIAENQKLIDNKNSDQDIQSYFKNRKEYFIENGFKRLEDGLFAYLYYDITADIALAEGDDGVGAVSVRDNNVRPTHRLNDQRCWKVGSKSPGGTIDPWKDFACRCSYSFQPLQDLQKQGFKL